MYRSLHVDAISLPPHSKLYTLEGGVHNYLTEEGGDLWNGSLFVFDGRLAVAPPGKPYSIHSHNTLVLHALAYHCTGYT